jgi:hypothetical protein
MLTGLWKASLTFVVKTGFKNNRSFITTVFMLCFWIKPGSAIPGFFEKRQIS